MNKRKIIIFGDSHTDAFKRVIKLVREPMGEQFSVQAFRYAQPKNGKIIGDLTQEEINVMLGSLREDDLIISTIGGNQHQVIGLVQHPIPFDIFEKEQKELLSDHMTLIPHAQMHEVFERGLRGRDGSRMEELKKYAPCPIVHLAPPPPKEDAEHILKRHETAFSQADILNKGVSPANLRLKIWKLQIEALRKMTQNFGIHFLLPPVETLTEQGFLAPQFYAEDATHANMEYAKLVLKQIEMEFDANK